jgi:hypothetical protein
MKRKNNKFVWFVVKILTYAQALIPAIYISNSQFHPAHLRRGAEFAEDTEWQFVN